MAINFPNSPANGDTHVSGEKTFNYDAAKGVWNLEGNLKVALDITSTPPSSPSHGDLWMDETTGDMYTYFTDADSSQWIQVNGVGAVGAGGGSGVITYANKAAIDAVSSPSEGDLAFDEDKNVLYIRAGSTWERIQHGGNVGPRITTAPAATHSLSATGSTSTITAVAVDENGFPVTYDWDGISGSTVYTASSLPDQITNVSESNGVFTLTPSTNSSHAGSFIFRTKASDGAQVSTATTNVSLLFGTNITTPSGYPFASSAGTNTFDLQGIHDFPTANAGFSSTLRTGKIYIELVMGSITSDRGMIGLCPNEITSAGYDTANTFSLYSVFGTKYPREGV
jgi:hypothetical protein